MSAAKIAARLTARERELLVALSTNPASVSFDDRLAAGRTRLLEVPFGWAVSDQPWSLTPLGREVRAIIEKERAMSDAIRAVLEAAVDAQMTAFAALPDNTRVPDARLHTQAAAIAAYLEKMREAEQATLADLRAQGLKGAASDVVAVLLWIKEQRALLAAAVEAAAKDVGDG